MYMEGGNDDDANTRRERPRNERWHQLLQNLLLKIQAGNTAILGFDELDDYVCDWMSSIIQHCCSAPFSHLWNGGLRSNAPSSNQIEPCRYFTQPGVIRSNLENFMDTGNAVNSETVQSGKFYGIRETLSIQKRSNLGIFMGYGKPCYFGNGNT